MSDSATLADVLASAAERAPDALALIDDLGSLTFAQLHQRVRAAETALSAITDRNGPVAVVGPNHRVWVELYYAAPTAGRLLVFLNHRLHERELASMIDRSGAELVIGDPAELGRLRDLVTEHPMLDWMQWTGAVDALIDQPGDQSERFDDRTNSPSVESDSLAWLLFTSGTTAAPKGALLTHSSILAAVNASAAARPVDEDDVYVFPFPLCHVAGYNVIHRHVHGRPVVLMTGFSAGAFCDIVEGEQVTSTSLAATMLATLVDLVEAEPGRLTQLRSLRSIAYGAAPMPTPLLRRANALFGVDFAQGYGMTELSGNAVFLDAESHRRGLAGEAELLESAGQPAPGVELQLVDELGNEVADGEVGEILVRAEQVMWGYLNDEESTNNALRNGWLHTGDMGRRLDGLLYVVDRKKDIIITGGENVSSLEVEAAVLEHPSVARVAVVGVPDVKWGENVCAVVVPEPGAHLVPQELVSFVRTRLAGFKLPRHVVVVDDLPVTASGKVVKAEIRSWLSANPERAGERL